MTSAEFCNRFPGNSIGEDFTETEATFFFVNASGEVGEIRQNRRTTVSVYSLLFGETADMVKWWYRPK